MLLIGMTGMAWAQDARQDTKGAAYLNPSLPAEQRAADLVKRMTLEEKLSQLTNQARAIPRLGVPAYDWWSEALHGVQASGTTEYPEPVALAATFDPKAIHEMAAQIGTEGRVIYEQGQRTNANPFHRGLDFWAPNINIFRDPRWGRGQETYGEDPFLTGRMGVAYVTGMQGDDPHYLRAVATPKHFAVHSGPEPTRHTADVTVSKHDELDTYLAAFRAAVTEGKAGSVMCAYNSINGEPACASEFLLQDQLRGKWGFQGYVVSDCGAVVNVFDGHHYQPTQPQASAISLERGMDNECVDGGRQLTDDHDYKPYRDAVAAGYLKESEIDTALIRQIAARIKLGTLDPPEMVPYAKIPDSELDSGAHREYALKLANESMVLLKNDGVLPLNKPGKSGPGKKILVVGPLAEQANVMLGNYNGTPTHTVSILDGMHKEFANDTIQYVQGTGFLSKETLPVPSTLMTTDGKPGAKVSYLKENLATMPMRGGGNAAPAPAPANAPAVLTTRVEPGIDVSAQPLPAEAAADPVTIRWETTLTPQMTADYNLGVESDSTARVTVNGRRVVFANMPQHGVEARTGRVHMDQGKPYQVVVEYSLTNRTAPHLRLVWTNPDRSVDPAAVAAAQNADVVVAVVGITSELEGEEMPVNEPGFKGGDRTSLDLPQPEEDLLEAMYATHKPLVVVLTNGSALAVNWANEHANAILDAWYPGEEGGNAIAETLSGKNNPAGRLPVTFYKSVDQLPPFEDYAMKGRTYRYFDGTPLYPFGYGLSYSTFSYSALTLPKKPVKAGDPLTVGATVTNTGKVAGDEVAQVYLTFPKVAGAPLRALRGFQRVHLAPGASQKVSFELNPRDMSMVTDAGEPIVAEGAYTVTVGGGQPNTAAPKVTGTLNVKGTLTLPE